MTNLLGVPDHARTEWEALGAALDESGVPAPCQGTDPDRWAGRDAMGAPSSHDRAASDACLDCPAMIACAAYALAAGERHGVWGGMSASERRALRKGGAR